MFSSVVLYFYLTSYLGWLLESTYRSISEKKIINSGFLFGPFVPIYGFGAIIIYFLSFALKDNSYVFQTTIYGFTSIFLEYLTALFFEKIFKIKLWDYSKEKINIHGRICLKFSLIWIILVVFIVEFGQKYLLILINKIPLVISNSLSVVLILYTIIDLFFSFKLFNIFAKIASFLKNVDIGELQNKINYVYKEKIMFDIKYFLKPIAK
ncbi:MAG: putative ABC transporter permease, partial [Spirochaetes bacterium]|nr:putative ABC transporter permease [Spirochaetota bacterium]